MDTGQPLVGQVAVVTGAGRGIGAAIARKLAQLGATDGSLRTHPVRARRNRAGDRERRGQDRGDSLRRHGAASTGIRRRPRRQHLGAPRHSRQQCRGRRPSPSPCTSLRRKNGSAFSTRICAAFTSPSGPSYR